MGVRFVTVNPIEIGAIEVAPICAFCKEEILEGDLCQLDGNVSYHDDCANSIDKMAKQYVEPPVFCAHCAETIEGGAYVVVGDAKWVHPECAAEYRKSVRCVTCDTPLYQRAHWTNKTIPDHRLCRECYDELEDENEIDQMSYVHSVMPSKAYEEDDDEEEEDEEEEDYPKKSKHGYYPKSVHPELITHKYFHEKDESTFIHGVSTKDPEQVSWRQLSGERFTNLEYLPGERQTKIFEFIERLEWIGATEIVWVRGGESIHATLPDDWFVARFLRGGKIPPPSSRAQYYFQSGHYTSMAFDVPPKLGHVCAISKKCIVCYKMISIAKHRTHEQSCDEPRLAQCGYVPARLRLRHQEMSHSHVDWLKLRRKHTCKVKVPVTLERTPHAIRIFRTRCERHDQIEQWVHPWMNLARAAAAKRQLEGAKKPHCKSCFKPVTTYDGLLIDDEYWHAHCLMYNFQYQDNYGKKKRQCGHCHGKTCGKGGPKVYIRLNGVIYGRDCAILYLKAQPYWEQFNKHTLSYIDPGQHYLEDEEDEEDEDEDELATMVAKALDLSDNPNSSAPNGWVPVKDKDAPVLDVECSLCMMKIGSAKRVEIDGKLYHDDCAPAVALL